jgi:hypothetical protein
MGYHHGAGGAHRLYWSMIVGEAMWGRNIEYRVSMHG